MVNADDNLNTNGGKNKKKDKVSDYIDVLIGGTGNDHYLRNHSKEKITHTNGGKLIRYTVPFGSYRADLVKVALPKQLKAGLDALARLGGPMTARVRTSGMVWLASLKATTITKYAKTAAGRATLQGSFQQTARAGDLARAVQGMWVPIARARGGSISPIVVIGAVGPLAPLNPLSGWQATCYSSNGKGICVASSTADVGMGIGFGW